MGDRDQRAFAEKKHADGAWSSAVSSSRSMVFRALWNFTSRKRWGIDRLATRAHESWRVLDLGCGRGAYAHWFLGKKAATIVAVDWSLTSLRAIPSAPWGKILRICADARMLPFSFDAFDAAYSVDTLGHFVEVNRALDELYRVVKTGAPLFLHSECADYRTRWPDRALIARLGEDLPARGDGHDGLRLSRELRSDYVARFTVHAFVCPAGVLGWLTGYPEKYREAFARARMTLSYVATTAMTFVKRTPVLGVALRLFNALTNHLELAIGATGGGSCFADLTKPEPRRGAED